MPAGLKRTVASFFMVLAGAAVYHFAFVPLIEPGFSLADPVGPIEPPPPTVKPSPAYAKYFAPGAWELKDPIVLENSRSKLLFQSYENRDGNRVMLMPCAIIFLPDGDVESAGSPNRVIVMEANQGALLQFDQPVDPQHGKIGQVLGGDMKGPITIRGTPSRPGANDALRVDTQDVQMNTQLIWTAAPVTFSLGESHGSGREMHIHLLPSSDPNAKKGANIGGLESFELLHEVQMRLAPGNHGLLPLDPTHSGKASAPPATKPAAPEPPIDIRCDGPFKFDLVQYVATFQDRVAVQRKALPAYDDDMTCNRLSIYFAPKAPGAGAPTTPAASPPPPNSSSQRIPNLEARRLVADGSPVVLVGRVSGVFVRGLHLDYDLALPQLTVEGGEEVVLRQQTDEIHAKSVVYRPEPEGRLGWLLAKGPGWLRGATPANAQSPAGHPSATEHGARTTDRIFAARWGDELKIRPIAENKVISLTGGAQAGFTDQGDLSADEIHLWVRELTVQTVGAAGVTTRTQLTPDRLLAMANVRINSPQCIGATDRLEAWFDQQQAAASSPRSSPIRGDGEGKPRASGPGWGDANAPINRPASPSFPAAAYAQSAPAIAPAPQRPVQQYSVAGQRLRLQLIVRDGAMEVEDVSIDGKAKFAESRTAQPGDVPLAVAGDQLEVLRANQPDTDVTVRGKPAQVGARGLELFGDVVRMNKQTNRMWIDGPGRMKLPENASADPLHAGAAVPSVAPNSRPAAPATPPDPMIVTWQGRMNFDGSLATFERNVVGQSQARNFRTEQLEVTMRRRIDFSQPHPDDRPEVGRIVCRGEFKMESRSFDPQGLTSIDRLQAKDLMVDEVTGAILGQGPGWLTSVRKGDPDPSQAPGGAGQQAGVRSQGLGGGVQYPNQNRNSNTVSARPVATTRNGKKRPADAGLGGEQLNYLNVQFQGALSGNLNQHEITFHDRVRSVYGPVLSWEDELNPDNVDDLGPGGVLLTCDQMTVRQPDAPAAPPTPPNQPPQTRRPIELEAIGNTKVEGDTFNAHAHRLTYTEAKDLLVLEGDGRNDAQLYRQERPGAPESKAIARQILFWRSQNRVSVNDARFFDLNQLPAPDTETSKDGKTAKQKPPK